MGIADTNILLESGTNELEVLEFVIAGHSYGINVSKITELMQIQEVSPMPLSHPCVEGVFQPRSEVYPLIDLASYLNLPPSESPEKDIYIITNFNKIHVAFHVHSVEGIYRISWKDIEKPDAIIYGGTEGVATGIAKIGDQIISILDFEKIAYDICPQTGIQIETIHNIEGAGREDCPVVVAEDSALLRKMLTEALTKAGYVNISMHSDGQEAWDYLAAIPEESVAEKVSCIITDIEMPRMDGHRLTKQVKTDPKLKKIPVVIFSSLIDDEMRKKGESVGADAQLSKPEIEKLVDTIDLLMNP